MKIRSDSPFADATKQDAQDWLFLSKHGPMVRVVETFNERMGRNCSISAMRKFLRRVEREQLLEEAEENADAVSALAKKGEDSSVREATLAAARQQMFDQAVEANDKSMLLEIFRSLNEEKAQERSLAVEERKIKVAEENAKLGWRKLECENARAGLKMLPTVQAILLDRGRNYEDRVKGALNCLRKAGAQIATEAGPELLAMPEPGKKEAA